MIRDWLVLAALGVCALLALLLLVVLVHLRGRTRRELDTARAETAALRRQLEEVQQALAGPRPDRAVRPTRVAEREYTITALAPGDPGDDPQSSSSPRADVDRALFADLVLRETVVRAASLAHGVRRALSAESRNRVRFEVRREVRRARKQRRADTREAVRQWEARQRADLAEDDQRDAGAA